MHACRLYARIHGRDYSDDDVVFPGDYKATVETDESGELHIKIDYPKLAPNLTNIPNPSKSTYKPKRMSPALRRYKEQRGWL